MPTRSVTWINLSGSGTGSGSRITVIIELPSKLTPVSDSILISGHSVNPDPGSSIHIFSIWPKGPTPWQRDALAPLSGVITTLSFSL